MSIIVFADVILHGSVISAVGVRGKQIRNNIRTQAQNGAQKININWSRTMRQYELGTVPALPSQWAAIEGLFEVTEGGAYGFLLPDPKDQSATVDTGRASLVSGTIYQLLKRYTSVGSTRTKDRTITRPVASGFAIYNSGVLITTYTLDTTTGRITIPSAPTAANLTWSGNFYVPVHFQSDMIDWELLRAGQADTRLIAGPSVVLDEVRE